MLKINIQDKLKEKGLNKNQFAKLAQIGYPAACALYDGKTTKISFDTLESVCKVLECTPNDILSSDDPTYQRLMTYAYYINKLQNTKGDTE
ncbi:helix-turn-helix domain-containing protein [Bariatricus sp. SGI.019]|uniref:helix-turn-helix domain-containing protein n=1 Tax=Bariatricus sp. SGI.019 TaxID=3420548 RepID=UPI003D08DE36